MAYYKAVLNGTAFGQAIVNVLWYRSMYPDTLALVDATTGEDVAFQIKAEVWPKLKAVMRPDYTLENISVYPFNNTLELAYNLPHVLAVNEAGTNAGSSNGPAPCLIYKANLNALPIANLLYPRENAALGPRRGYWAIGPIGDDAIGNDGHLPNSALNTGVFKDLADALGSTLENLVPPAVFVPVKARTVKVAGVVTLQGFNPVQSVTIRTRASFRRSRLPEN